MPAPQQPVPARLYHEGGRIMADWADIAGTDPTLPFLVDRIARAGSFWQAPLPPGDGPVVPAALILHAGRCGSTLVSRSLSRLSRCHLLSEPQALNDVLGVDGPWPFLPVPERRQAVRRVVAALAQAARPGQDRFILKLSSWNALHLPLLEEAFPRVPKLFIYRHPAEILVSLRDAPTGWMRRAEDRIKAGLFLGVPPAQALNTPLAFAAQMLGRILSAVAESMGRPERAGEWLLVPYETLPVAFTARILPWLELEPTEAEAAILASFQDIHAKDPTGQRHFQPDSVAKRAAVTAELAELIRDLVCNPYERLERLRFHAAGVEG